MAGITFGFFTLERLLEGGDVTESAQEENDDVPLVFNGRYLQQQPQRRTCSPDNDQLYTHSPKNKIIFPSIENYKGIYILRLVDDYSKMRANLLWNLSNIRREKKNKELILRWLIKTNKSAPRGKWSNHPIWTAAILFFSFALPKRKDQVFPVV